MSRVERVTIEEPIGARRAGERCRRDRFSLVVAASAALLLSACAGTDKSDGSKSWLDDTPLSFLRDIPSWTEKTFGGSGSGKQASAKDPVGDESAEAGKADAAKSEKAPTGKTAPASRRKPQVAAIAPTPNPTPKTEPVPEPPLDPKTLVGLDEREVMRVLGQPEHVRSKPPATVWAYKQKNCTLEVFFYLDISTERFRVLAYEVESGRGTKETKKVCLGRIIQSALRTN